MKKGGKKVLIISAAESFETFTLAFDLARCTVFMKS